jgi:hypothetical protein
MKSLRISLVTLAMALLLTGVATAQKVRLDYDRDADFSQYRTYKWVEVEGAAPLDQLTDGHIRTAIETTLAGKGLTKATGDEADVWIAYQVSVAQETQINSYNTGGGYWGFRRGYGGGMQTATTSTINIGTLVLDFYDPDGEKLVWRGIATKTLKQTKDPETRVRRLQEAVDKLLKDYPPTAG